MHSYLLIIRQQLQPIWSAGYRSWNETKRFFVVVTAIDKNALTKRYIKRSSKCAADQPQPQLYVHEILQNSGQQRRLCSGETLRPGKINITLGSEHLLPPAMGAQSQTDCLKYIVGQSGPRAERSRQRASFGLYLSPGAVQAQKTQTKPQPDSSSRKTLWR